MPNCILWVHTAEEKSQKISDLAHTFLYAVKIRSAFLSVVSQTQDIAKYFPKGRVNFDLLAQDFLIMGD